ncbi:hypothetical protein [Nocardioides sp.]|uniref:hypothetical protein n=1 Tax=Nocardioides sp. TaxID=35761 RepID=UPI002CAFAD6D|nr:hypothetical protein [Nocardioides sp.]HXH79541.1 hypothetical protein [Nocardioides sp.]
MTTDMAATNTPEPTEPGATPPDREEVYVLAMIQVLVPADAANPDDPNATVDAVRAVIGPKPTIFDVGYGAWGQLRTGSSATHLAAPAPATPPEREGVGGMADYELVMTFAAAERRQLPPDFPHHRIALRDEITRRMALAASAPAPATGETGSTEKQVEAAAAAFAQTVLDGRDDGRRWHQLVPEVQGRYRDQARAALAGAVGEGGRIFSAEDVADLRTILDNPKVRSRDCTNIHDEVDRLRALLEAQEGA